MSCEKIKVMEIKVSHIEQHVKSVNGVCKNDIP